MGRLRPPGFGEPGRDPSGFGEPGRDPSGFGEPGRGPSGDGAQDLALLRLLQVFDSQFPVGGFAHSGGLETYAALEGALPELRQVLDAQITLGWGRSELGAACLAWCAANSDDSTRDLDRLAETLDAVKVVPAMRDMSIGLGRRTADLLRRLYPGVAPDLERPHHALIVGAAGRRLGIDVRPLLLAFAQSLAISTLAAAVRCMPVSSVQAQEVLIEVQPHISAAVERAFSDPEACLFTCTPALDIRSHQQAHLHTRLFQS